MTRARRQTKSIFVLYSTVLYVWRSGGGRWHRDSRGRITMHAESMRHDAESNEQLVEGLGTAIFCRALGAGLIYFAINTTPVYTDLVENTVLLFAYPPWHHLPLPAPSSELLEALRWTLLACGCGIAIGVIPRVCLLISGACVAYQLSLDRTIYNNHYVLIIMLCWLLLVVDGSCLAWRLHLCSHAPSAQSAPSASPASPALPSWQLTAVQLLLLTPYWYGAIAKLNPSWLLHAQPVLSWADGLLGELDAVTRGGIGQLIDALILPETDVLRPFAFTVAYAGLLLDLIAPSLLFYASRPSARRPVILHVVSLVCVAFHLTNKLWFGLGVFPYLNVAALCVFVVPAAPLSPSLRAGSPSPPVATRHSTPSTTPCVPPPSSQSSARRRWARRVILILSVPHFLVPLRHFVWHWGERSSFWTEEGLLYAWRMKSVEKAGWVVLEVRGSRRGSDGGGGGKDSSLSFSTSDGVVGVGDGVGGCSHNNLVGAKSCPSHMGAANKHIVLRLIPETDTALHTDQAGELAYTPIMLLRYAEHLEALLGLHGIVNVSVAAIGSCVSANGFAPQSLFQPTANLLEHLPGYTSLRAELTGHSGIGTFLYPWRAAGPSEGSQSSYSQSVELCDVRAPPEGQHRSDQAYRWLYSPLYSRRHKADWPFRRGGWSRLPTISDATAPWPPADVAPEWARRCSFLHAAGTEGSIWCPIDADG